MSGEETARSLLHSSGGPLHKGADAGPMRTAQTAGAAALWL